METVNACYASGHDRVCIERVLGGVRLVVDASATTIILTTTDAGVASVFTPYELPTSLVFGGGYVGDDCRTMSSWMFK